MNTNAITIKDIAQALGMSVSTVSRALKGSYSISEATKKQVIAYAQAHNYRPNLFAQSLKNKQSRSIGVMLPSVPNNFFAEVINGMEAVASGRNYHIIITQSHESIDKELANLDHLHWRSVDGILVSLSSETENLERFEQLKAQGLPIVYFDRVPAQAEVHKVTADNFGGAYALTRHFLQSGYRNIAHITSAPHLSITRERLSGYQAALQEAGIEPRAELVQYCMHGGMDHSENETAIDQLLSLPEPPDAVLTASDRLTLHCMSVIKNRGIAIPGQMALGGFSNFSATELFCPALTTVVQPAFEMGKTAMELLLNIVESKRPLVEFQHVVLPTELQERDSSRPAAKYKR